MKHVCPILKHNTTTPGRRWTAPSALTFALEPQFRRPVIVEEPKTEMLLTQRGRQLESFLLKAVGPGT